MSIVVIFKENKVIQDSNLEQYEKLQENKNPMHITIEWLS